MLQQFASPLQRRQQGGLVALIAVELRLLSLLLGTARRFAAQAQVAVEAKLELAVLRGDQPIIPVAQAPSRDPPAFATIQSAARPAVVRSRRGRD